MTPFGERLRQLRAERGITLKEMAEAIGVSAAYLSALEHGKRGRPGWHLLQRIIAFLNIIWDDAEELIELARLSHPRVVIDTSGLSPEATRLANLLARHVRDLDQETLRALIARIEKSLKDAARPQPSAARRRVKARVIAAGRPQERTTRTS